MKTFGSVCSGIEAASVAWLPLGWKQLWLSEIEPFPCAVLKHHYPETPNLGDMVNIADMITSGEVDAPDVLTGGTPCQSFSISGLRKGLSDDRGKLSLEFCRIANAIDTVRSGRGQQPSIIVWENVPGVLSSGKGEDFASFLAGLSGEEDGIEPPGKGWANAGVVVGPQRTVAWRVLDAQYFGLAQQRRRVWVVASAAEVDPCQILFEPEGVRRDSAPSREEGQGAASSAEARTASGKPVFGTLMANAETKLCTGNQEAFSGDFFIIDTPSGSVCNAFAIQERACHPDLNAGPGGKGYREGLAYTLEARPHVQSVAFQQNSRDEVRAIGGGGQVVGCIAGEPGVKQQNYIKTQTGRARRLTPTECERLQGFPDGYTQIQWKGKPAEECPDGPRYKAIGNSWAVPCARWIGERIEASRT